MRSLFGNISRKFCKLENFEAYRYNGTRSLNKIEKRNVLETENVLSSTNPDPNKFGPDYMHDEFIETESDKKENEYLTNYPPKKLTIKQYSMDIKDYLNKGLLINAINVVDIDMKKSRVAPDRYIFNLLISGAAQRGQMELAFHLFQKMKNYGCVPNGGTYTSLFNSCANTFASKHVALKKANYLRNLIHEKSIEINIKTYNAIIKAYGRCDDIQTAFLLVDELIEKDIRLTTETYNFLLQACASKKTSGFFYGLLIWNKMNKNHCYPDKDSFNLFLRCIRDCSIGNDVKLIRDALFDVLKDDHLNLEIGIIPKEIRDDEKMNENYLEINSTNEKVPLENNASNRAKAHLLAEYSINEESLMGIKSPAQRLQLIGGFSGFLRTMKSNRITPNIKTFTLLLEVIPGTIEFENELILMLKKIGLKTDIDFFNILIRKRSMRFDYENAKNVLQLIKLTKLQPNISTYGVLALGCKTPDQANQFLENMEIKDIKVNIEILGTLLRQGTAQNDFVYVAKILQITLDKQLKPNEEFLKHLEKFFKKCLKIEKKQSQDTIFLMNFNNFHKKLNVWKQKNGIEGLNLEQSIRAIQKQYKKSDEEMNFIESTKNFELIKKKKTMKYINKIQHG